MLEKDIENLIAKYPQEFFPKESLLLKGQQIKVGNCFTDVIFTDKFDRLIIIEIKRGILTREASGQIIEYYGLLKEQNPSKSIELILCANIIPRERRHFLEAVGIECKELGLSLITEVAKKYNYKFLDEVKEVSEKGKQIKESIRFNLNEDISNKSVWLFQGVPEKFDVINALSDPTYEIKSWMINQHVSKIRTGDIALIWMSGKQAGIYAVADVISNPEISSPESEKYWIDLDLRAKNKYRAKLKITHNLVNKPVLKEQLKNIKELAGLRLLKPPYQGTNFRITKSEWEIIKTLI